MEFRRFLSQGKRMQRKNYLYWQYFYPSLLVSKERVECAAGRICAAALYLPLFQREQGGSRVSGRRVIRRSHRIALNREEIAEVSSFLILYELINCLLAAIVAVWRIKPAVHTAMQISAAKRADRSSVNLPLLYHFSAFPAHIGISV